MPTAATKLAPKQTALSKPASILAGPDPAVVADLEIIRLGIAAQAAGEEIDDAEEYAAAAHRRGFTPLLETFAVEASRSIGDLSNWSDEHAERLAEVEADEIKWATEYRRLDVALSAARIEHRKAVNDRENLRVEDQQNRYIKQVNPLLCGPVELAAKSIEVPALTREEAGRIQRVRYQDWAIDTERQKKLHYALQDQQAAK